MSFEYRIKVFALNLVGGHSNVNISQLAKRIDVLVERTRNRRARYVGVIHYVFPLIAAFLALKMFMFQSSILQPLNIHP